jgi:hypothetical protein
MQNLGIAAVLFYIEPALQMGMYGRKRRVFKIGCSSELVGLFYLLIGVHLHSRGYAKC